MSPDFDTRETPAERLEIERAVRRAQFDDQRRARMRGLVWIGVALLVITAVAFLGFYLGDRP